MSFLAHRARGKDARDATKYGRSRTSTRSFFVHHAERLAAACAIGEAAGIHKAIKNRKRRVKSLQRAQTRRARLKPARPSESHV